MYDLKDLKIKPIVGLKKTIVYSNDQEKEFVEGALNILAARGKKSPSAALEDLIADTLLPDQPTARFICKDLYASRLNTIGALERVFSVYAEGINFAAKYRNGHDLVEYLRDELVDLTYPSDKGSYGDRAFFCNNFKQVCEKIKKAYETDHEDDLSVYESPVKFARYLLDLAIKEPESFRPVNLTEIILSHWDTLGDFTYTFRSLSALCRLLIDQKTDCAEDRVKLVELLSRISKEWD